MNRLITILLLLCSIAAATAQTNRVTLEWNANSEANVAGYVVSYGTNSGFSVENSAVWTSPLITATNCAITNLTAGRTYFFSVKAVDTDGFESDPSDEISWTSVRKPKGLRRVRVTVAVVVHE